MGNLVLQRPKLVQKAKSFHLSLPGSSANLDSNDATYTFEDGSTIVARTQRLMVRDQSGTLSAKVTSELIKGTGRFEGIKGTGSATGRQFLASKGEPMKNTNDFTWTYTLPTK